VLPYDPLALFNRSARSLPLRANSGAIAENVAQNAATARINVTADGEVPTVYVASPSDPLYTVRIDGRDERFRVPAGAVQGGGADHPTVILDRNHPDHGEFVELRIWQGAYDHANRRISGNGVGLFHYNNDGRILNPNGTRSLSYAFRGWGTGSDLSYLAGLVRPEAIEAGEVRHAIRVAWGCNNFTNGFVAPATKTDQNATRCDGGLVPADQKVDMGQRLRLDPQVDCDARTAPVLPGRTESVRETRFLRIMCRAMQEYGLIVLDGAPANHIVVYLENDTTASWVTVAGQTLYGGYGYIFRDRTTPSDGMSRTAASGIPWDRFQAVN
jgi:hypothetical protein